MNPAGNCGSFVVCNEQFLIRPESIPLHPLFQCYRCFAVEIDLEDRQIQTFLQEEATMKKLNHPNILLILGVSIHDGKACIINHSWSTRIYRNICQVVWVEIRATNGNNLSQVFVVTWFHSPFVAESKFIISACLFCTGRCSGYGVPCKAKSCPQLGIACE